MAWYDDLLTGVDAFFDDDKYKNLRNILGTTGQLAVAEKSIDDLQGLGEDAKDFLGFPRTGANGLPQGLYDTVKADTSFKPLSVTALPGSVNIGNDGSTTFNLSPEQEALEKSLRTGGSQLIDAILGRNNFGTLNPETGEMEQNMRGGQQGLIDMLAGPFSAENLANTEQSTYDRLRAIRAPNEEREQTALTNQLIGQGRQGLQTAQYGGSPEQFALSKAIEEQKSADVISSMNLARQDAQSQSDATLQALRQQVLEKELGGNLADVFLKNSYLPQESLVSTTSPALDAASLANVSGRQLGGYGAELGAAALDFDMNAEQLATDLRREALNSLFNLMISEQNSAGGVAAAEAGAGNSSDDPIIGIGPGGFTLNPNSILNKYRLGGRSR
jgi:hypothetical protein